MKRIKPILQSNRVEFYDALPKEQTNFTDFQRLAVLRIKTLRINENTSMDEHIKDIVNKEDDILSHFYTRMLCAQSLWSAKWFVTQETSLFRRRLKNLEEEEIEENFSAFFLHLNDLDTKNKRISPQSEYFINNPNKISFDKSYKVHFKFVIDLLANRKVSLVNGYTELTQNCYKSVMINFYRLNLERRMMNLYKHYVNNPDERIKSIYNRLFINTDSVNGSSINSVINYLPPCINLIIKKANTENHLKYTDRQTLILFLKDAGVPLQNCIDYLRSVFKVTKEVFDKEYLYSIRHNYGQEGKKATYKSYSCNKIINNSVDTQCVSCPFKRKSNLKEYFSNNNLEIEDLNELFKNENYQNNCTALLGKIIKKEINEPINTPIEFFKVYKKEKEN